MSISRILSGAATLAILMALLPVDGLAAPLIKESEASLPPAVPIGGKIRAITRGPGIRVISPDPSAAVRSPFNFKLTFEARGGASVDPASVRLIYLKSPSIDLIDRVRPGLSEHGIELTNAEAPVGEHRIRVSLQDSEGRESVAIINLNVVK